MKKEIKDLSMSLLKSLIVGVLVALPFNFIFRQRWISYILISALAGFSIGLVAHFVFYFATLIINHRPLIAFFSIFLIIGSGTSSVVYFLATKDLRIVGLITTIAELAGLTMTYISWRKSVKYNLKLDETKERLLRKKKVIE